MSNYSSSFDYNEYDNDPLCQVNLIRDIELKSFIRDDLKRKQSRERCVISCTTCIGLIMFVIIITYIAMWTFEYYNIEQTSIHSNSSHKYNNNNTI